MTGGDDEEVFTADHTTTIMDTKEDIILVAGAETELSIIESDPKSLQEACAHQDWPQWQKVMDKEIDTLEHAGTWVNVPRPTNRNIVSSKWVFCIKHKANGEIDKYKVHLVACGFTQIYGIDYYSTYWPVAKMASIQLILALATRQDWEIESFNFNSTYLNGKLQDNKEIYMEPPPGYENVAPNYVKRLQKSLYGLKQAGW